MNAIGMAPVRDTAANAASLVKLGQLSKAKKLVSNAASDNLDAKTQSLVAKVLQKALGDSSADTKTPTRLLDVISRG